VLYILVPQTGLMGSVALFVAGYAVIMSMYGGGFATIPAYLRDIFGVMHVGAIHGRLLTAWSVAGVLGPVLVNYIRQYQIDHGVPRAQAYSITMYVLVALLVIGFVCNALVKPTPAKHFMTPEQLAATAIPARNNASSLQSASDGNVASGLTWIVPAAWLAVWIPIGWGVYVTLKKALPLFLRS